MDSLRTKQATTRGPWERTSDTYPLAGRVAGRLSRAACRALVLLPLLAPLLSAGCRQANRRMEPLEADNRKKECEIRELRERLDHAEAVNNGLMREVYGAQAVPLPRAASAKAPDVTAPAVGLKEIALGRGTGGIDEDKLPGDEALHINLEPRDVDNHVTKVPGTLQIFVFEVKPEGTKVPIGSWEIPPEKLRHLWKPGLFSNGYVIVLPWQKCPTTKKVRVVARFTLSNGRVFEADKDVAIKPPQIPPPPQSPQHGAPMPTEEPPGPNLVPERESPLPLPRTDGETSRSTNPGPLTPASMANGSRAATLLAPEPRR
jgi:hypothetical protein